MARTFQISDGTNTVSLISSTGFIPTGRRLKPVGYSHRVRLPSNHLRFVENFELNLESSDHDNAASQLHSLHDLLRKAQMFQESNWQTLPVYLQAQTAGETGARYAIIYGSDLIDLPDMFDHPFEQDNFMENVQLRLTRGCWTDAAPGTLPTAKTLTATSGPINDTFIPVSNVWDNGYLQFLKNYDASATSFENHSSDGAAWTLFSISGSSMDTDDALYFLGRSTGGAAPYFNTVHSFVMDIATAGDFEATIVAEAYDSDASAWAGLTLGDEITVYPNVSTLDDVFKSTGQWIFNVNPDVWSRVTIDSDSRAWWRLRVSAFTSETTPIQHSSDDPYVQSKPYIELDSDQLNGDLPPVALFRMYAPGGATDSDPTFGTISYIAMGAKSRNTSGFLSHLNCVYPADSDWAATFDTDTTATSDINAPEGWLGACTFTADSLMVERVRLTGTNKADDYAGQYRVFLRAEQVGDTDETTQVSLITYLTDTDGPKQVGETYKLQTHDAGWEIIDLGFLQVPFTETVDTDALETDLIFSIRAERTSGSATINFADLILIPVDEWSLELEDPISDDDTGASALRGKCMLELDDGILRPRTIKYYDDSPGETWYRDGEPITIEPKKVTRVYFLMGHYSSEWGVGPYIGSLGMQLGIEFYANAVYQALRGSE